MNVVLERIGVVAAGTVLFGSALAMVGASAPRPATPSPAGGSAISEPPAQAAAPHPFVVGEQLHYDAKVNIVRVGSASMAVEGIDTVRGRPAYHTRFSVRGRMLFYRVNDRYESWFDRETLSSLRYVQEIDQGSYERERRFDFFPDRRAFREGDKDEEETVAQPLDDGSFLYFIRTIPLEVGHQYEFNRYFRPDRNPVIVRVVRRERVRVPAGEFDAIVVQPVIKSRGMFSESGRAEIWFSDDDRRLMLRLTSRLSFGTLHLELKRVEGR